LQHIYHLLPTEQNISRPLNRKRSLLPIGGVLLSQLFGTTSEADLQPIRDHIKRIAQGISHLDHGLQMQHNQFASFIEFSAQRMDSFRNLTTMQERAISDLYDEIHTIFNTESQDQHRLVMALQRMQKYITQLRHIDELCQSIEFLIQGILTPQLVSETTLRTNLLIIKTHLQQFFPNIHLIFERASNFYAMHNFRFGRDDKRLLIQLQFPLTTFNHNFLVFEVTSFPVPVTGRTTHSF